MSNLGAPKMSNHSLSFWLNWAFRELALMLLALALASMPFTAAQTQVIDHPSPASIA